MSLVAEEGSEVGGGDAEETAGEVCSSSTSTRGRRGKWKTCMVGGKGLVVIRECDFGEIFLLLKFEI